MKKVLLAVVAALFLAAANVHAVGISMPFGFGGSTWDAGFSGRSTFASVGLRLQFSDMFMLQPSLAFRTAGGDGVSDNEDVTFVDITVDALFNVFETNGISHYVGGGVGLLAGGDNTPFRIGGIYGLAYPVTGSIDIFGQMGIGLLLQEKRTDFFTVNTQAGMIFHISGGSSSGGQASASKPKPAARSTPAAASSSPASNESSGFGGSGSSDFGGSSGGSDFGSSSSSDFGGFGGFGD